MAGQNYPKCPVLPHFRLFFHFRGERTLHNVQFLVSCSRGADHSTLTSPWLPAICWTSRLLASRTPVQKPSAEPIWCPLVLKMQLPSCAWVLYSNFALQALPKSLHVCSSFWGSSFHIIPCPSFPDDVYLVLCQSSMVGHLPAGGGQFLSVSTIILAFPPARCEPLCCLFSTLPVSTVATSLGTFSYTTTNLIFSGFTSKSMASIFPRQAIISLWLLLSWRGGHPLLEDVTKKSSEDCNWDH
jgi:hypothetical protein